MNQKSIDPVFQSVVDLGEPQAVYKQQKIAKFWRILIGAICISGGFYALYYGLVVYRNLRPNMSITAFVFAAILLLVFGIVAVGKTLLNWGETVVLYRDGLAYTADGSEVSSFRWSEIKLIKMSIVNVLVYGVVPTGSQQSYVIETNKRRLKLDGALSQVHELIHHVRKNSFPHIAAIVRQKLDSGESVKFGRIIINKSDGVRRDARKYRWNEVAQVKVVNGMIVFQPKKRVWIFSGINDLVRNTPNLDILLAISDEMIKQNASISSSQQN